MKKMLFAGVCAASLAFGSLVAVAQDDVVAQRQELMKSNGAQMKALAGMAKGETAFDAGKVQEAGKTLKANFEKAADMWPEGSMTDKSYAKPEIWSDMDGFKAALEKAIKASETVAAVSDDAGLKAAMGEIGGACKGCHDKFKKPKES